VGGIRVGVVGSIGAGFDFLQGVCGGCSEQVTYASLAVVVDVGRGEIVGGIEEGLGEG
jgi:hypothetical protein